MHSGASLFSHSLHGTSKKIEWFLWKVAARVCVLLLHLTLECVKMVQLVLHFDLNKTLIMKDSGVNLNCMLNSLLSEVTWWALNLPHDTKVGADTPVSNQWIELGQLFPHLEVEPSSLPPSHTLLASLGSLPQTILDTYPHLVPPAASTSGTDSLPLATELRLMTYDDFLWERTHFIKKKIKEAR